MFSVDSFCILFCYVGGRSFLIVNNSQLMKLAQMYEFTAESVQEKKRWEENIEKAMKGTSSKRERERKRVISIFNSGVTVS